MTSGDLLAHRLRNQGLTRSTFETPEEVVTFLGAMQAQEYAMAKWAIGLRLRGVSELEIENAVNRGAILRTHVLRPTWHFVAPADIRWMIELTGSRVRAQIAYRHRELEIDAALLKRSAVVVGKALRGGKHLTRAEIQAEFARARIAASGPRLAHLLMSAELDALICSGARQDTKSTYALLEERVAPTKPRDREDALVELTRRYFTSRGPATAEDFSWWSGLTLKDCRCGIAGLDRSFARATLGGREYVFPDRPLPRGKALSADFLMPDYDEYGIAYKDRSALFAAEPPPGVPTSGSHHVGFNRMIVVNSRIIGSWKRTCARDEVVIEVLPFERLNESERRSVVAAAKHYAAFIQKKPRLAFLTTRPTANS